MENKKWIQVIAREGKVVFETVVIKKPNVCGNSNMRDLTDEERRAGRSHRCSEDDPCEQCISSNLIQETSK